MPVASPSPQVMPTKKYLQTLPNVSWRAKWPQVENHWSKNFCFIKEKHFLSSTRLYYCLKLFLPFMAQSLYFKIQPTFFLVITITNQHGFSKSKLGPTNLSAFLLNQRSLSWRKEDRTSATEQLQLLEDRQKKRRCILSCYRMRKSQCKFQGGRSQPNTKEELSGPTVEWASL